MPREKICVSRKILADIGRGIYRTPASAIKELVSNAFDACATWVKITTNSPYFDVFTCEDNGEGMTANEFKKILTRIGSSPKRANEAKYKYWSDVKRPIIGKIGIGLLAVSQICDRFTVISKKKDERERFKAIIDLLQFEKGGDYLSGEKEIALGEYEIELISIPEEEINISYTKIIMESLKEGFSSALKEEFKKQIIRPKDTASGVRRFTEFVESLHGLRDFKSITTYDYFIWELGLLCPVKYFEEDNVIFPSSKFIDEDIKRLENYKFRLYMDGLEIYKPIFFKKGDNIKREKEDFKIYVLPRFNEEVAGSRLKFHGYIYSQRVKIRPTELQGILIRIKDIAIGNYDKSILKYPREEGPIFSMISGEIFIEEGLENALNIDRNSFNETRPHYQRLQLYLHKFIKERVVNDIRERSRLRRKKEKQERIDKELQNLLEKIKCHWKMKFSIEVRNESWKRPYLFLEKEKKLIIYSKDKKWAKSEKERLLQMRSIIAFSLVRYFGTNIDPETLFSDIVFGKE